MTTDLHILAFSPYLTRHLAKPANHSPCINRLFYYRNTFSPIPNFKDLLRKPTYPLFMRKSTTEFYSQYSIFMQIIFAQNSHIFIYPLSLKPYLFNTKNCKSHTNTAPIFLHQTTLITPSQARIDLHK